MTTEKEAAGDQGLHVGVGAARAGWGSRTKSLDDADGLQHDDSKEHGAVDVLVGLNSLIASMTKNGDG